ncbi:MAG: lysylphosphatidylglycerol synthase domain-containing protein [Actinomycetota bacterium]|nr:lysylphosphatidylglycerol synthase domain-containing protein [Actinomycetota bacterium]
MLLRIVFVAVVIAALVWAVVKQWGALTAAASTLALWPALGSFLLILAGVWCGYPTWRELLAGLGSHVAFLPGQRVFALGQLGKYIPGGIWNILAQSSLAKELNVPRARSGAAGLLALIISLPVIAAMSAVSLALSGRSLLGHFWWAPLIALPLLVFLHPSVLHWLIALAGRITRRTLPLERIPGRCLVKVAAWTVLGMVLSGLHLMILVAMVARHLPSPLLTIGVYTLAWLAGLIVVFAPAGAGVREAVIVFGLSPYLNPGSALLVALLSRALGLVADVLLAAVSWAADRTPRTRGRVGVRLGESS